jgi:hypothetical protein
MTTRKTQPQPQPLPKGKAGPVRTGKVDPAVLASDDFAAALAAAVWEPPTREKASKGDGGSERAALPILWPEAIRTAAAALQPPMELPDQFPSGKAKMPGHLASFPTKEQMNSGCLDRSIPAKLEKRVDTQLALLLDAVHGKYGDFRFPAMSEGYKLPLANLLEIIKKHPRTYKDNVAMQRLHNSGQTCLFAKIAKVTGRIVAMDANFELYLIDTES